MKNVKPEVLAELNRLQRILIWWSMLGVILAVLGFVLQHCYGPLWVAFSGLGCGIGMATGFMSRTVRKLVTRLIGEWAINGGEI